MYFGKVTGKIQNGKKWECEIDILQSDNNGESYKVIVARTNLEPISSDCKKELSEINQECMHNDIETMMNKKLKKKVWKQNQ